MSTKTRRHTDHCRARMKWGDGECECFRSITLDEARGLIEEASRTERRRWVRFVIESCPENASGMHVAVEPRGIGAANEIVHAAFPSAQWLDGGTRLGFAYPAPHPRDQFARLIAVAPSCGWTVERRSETDAWLSKPENA